MTTHSLALDQVRVVVRHDVLVARRLHDRDLVGHQLVGVLAELHHLDGDLGAARAVDRAKHLAGGALANLGHLVVQLVRVGRIAELGQRELRVARGHLGDDADPRPVAARARPLAVEHGVALEQLEHGVGIVERVLLGDLVDAQLLLPRRRQAREAGGRVEVDVNLVLEVERRRHVAVVGAEVDRLDPRLHLVLRRRLNQKRLADFRRNQLKHKLFVLERHGLAAHRAQRNHTGRLRVAAVLEIKHFVLLNHEPS
jgi:hypothetical protein